MRDHIERRTENAYLCFPPVSVYGDALLARSKKPLITNGNILVVRVEFCVEIDHSLTTNFIPTYVLKQQSDLEMRRGTLRLGIYCKILYA